MKNGGERRRPKICEYSVNETSGFLQQAAEKTAEEQSGRDRPKSSEKERWANQEFGRSLS